MKRRHSLYCLVLSNGGQLVMVQMPDHFVAWTELRQRIYDFMKNDLSIKVKDIFSIEGLNGDPNGVPDDPDQLPRFQKAFAGSTEHFPKFTLYAWDDTSRSFKLARAAIPQPAGQ